MPDDGHLLAPSQCGGTEASPVSMLLGAARASTFLHKKAHNLGYCEELCRSRYSDEGEPRDAAARALATDYGGREKAEPEPAVLLRGKKRNSGTRFGCDPSDRDLLLRER